MQQYDLALLCFFHGVQEDNLQVAQNLRLEVGIRYPPIKWNSFQATNRIIDELYQNNSDSGTAIEGRYIGDGRDYYLITSPSERVPGEGVAPMAGRRIWLISINTA